MARLILSDCWNCRTGYVEFHSSASPSPLDWNVDARAISICKGWHDQIIESHFKLQRHLADNAPPDLNMQWFRRMKIVLGEIDDAVWCVPARMSLNFLDLG